MGARGGRNRLFTYIVLILFVIYSLSRIRQLNNYSSGLGHATADMTERLWPYDAQLNGIGSRPGSQTPLGKAGGTADGAARKEKPARKTKGKSGTAKLSFYEIAIEKGTDKVTMHAYQDIYQRNLPAQRNGKIKMLEIGLGCKDGFGARASYSTWMEYFPNVDLYFAEADAECADKLRGDLEDAMVVTGDLTDERVLEDFRSKHGSDFDVIISGGDLNTMQQTANLESLWKTLKPGGVYFCEYLETGYLEKYGEDRVIYKTKETMVQYIHKIIEDLMYPDPNLEAYNLKEKGVSWSRKVQFEEVESIKHIDCERQICAILKRAD